MSFFVKTTEDSVSIHFRNQKDPVLHWDQLEWEEDPSVVIAIVNAINEAHNHPTKFHSFLIDKGILNNVPPVPKKWAKDFIDYVETGKATPEFLLAIMEDRDLSDAIWWTFNDKSAGLEAMAKSLGTNK